MCSQGKFCTWNSITCRLNIVFNYDYNCYLLIFNFIMFGNLVPKSLNIIVNFLLFSSSLIIHVPSLFFFSENFNCSVPTGNQSC